MFESSPNQDRVFLASIVVIALVIVVLLGTTIGTGNSLPHPIPDWAADASFIASVSYLILLLIIVASLIERIIETLLGLSRGREKLKLIECVNDAVRARKDNKNRDRDVEFRRLLLDAELELLHYRADTRLLSQICSLLLGSLFVALIDLPATELLTNSGSANSFVARALEILVLGILIAGGSEPLHDIITGISKSVRGVANIANKTKPAD